MSPCFEPLLVENNGISVLEPVAYRPALVAIRCTPIGAQPSNVIHPLPCVSQKAEFLQDSSSTNDQGQMDPEINEAGRQQDVVVTSVCSNRDA